MSEIKQRTAAQKKGEKGAGLTALIQDSEEQENEIKQLRRENAAQNDRAQITLDVGVMTNLLLTVLEASTYTGQPELRNFVALAQFLLLPFSLTPDKIPYVKTSWAAPFYPYVFRIQVTLAITAVYELYTHSQLSIPAVFRWCLPAVTAGGVWLQRRSEKEAEERLARLEKSKYNVKGA